MINNHEQWAGKLVQCIHDMGERHTNAVLLSLDGSQSIKPYQRYPDTPFYFGNNNWRVFYHSHGSPRTDQQEHGHFHFFTRLNKQSDWAHVVALGMDNYGQPMRLFTTNRWVTDGDWLELKDFYSQLAELENSEDDGLPQSWFKYILLLYMNEIIELLIERDKKVSQLYSKNREQCFLDRSIYYLSNRDINLNEQLFDVFRASSSLVSDTL